MTYLQIPSTIWPHISKLSSLQLAIYCDAITWGQQGGTARRSNDTLAEMFGVSSRAISKSVARLVELGLVDLEKGSNNIRIIKPRTTVHLNDCSPRTTVHPERMFMAEMNDCSMQHGTTVHGSPEQVFTQVEHRVEHRVNHGVEKGDDESFSEFETVQEPEAAPTNPARGARSKSERKFHDVVMPWETETFKAAWREWLDYRWAQHKFHYKRAQDEQIAIHQLQNHSNGNEPLAIHIIATSIANGWRGLFPGAAKSYVGPGSRSGSHLRASGEYAHPSDVLKDRNIWG